MTEQCWAKQTTVPIASDFLVRHLTNRRCQSKTILEYNVMALVIKCLLFVSFVVIKSNRQIKVITKPFLITIVRNNCGTITCWTDDMSLQAKQRMQKSLFQMIFQSINILFFSINGNAVIMVLLVITII